jgi:predicted Zn-dependent protease
LTSATKSNDQSFGITLFIDDGKEVVATASTSAQITKNSIVIAVATAKKLSQSRSWDIPSSKTIRYLY